ncbi:MAG: lysophospholipase L1-like esterase [Cyclobacteriaceae bacterium]|jgi:lysophospholipase L1-like esterase
MSKLISRILVLYLFTSITTSYLHAQDPKRFKGEIKTLKSKVYNFSRGEEVYLFTGSSSIRKWGNIPEYFPEKNIINNGFGGSQMSDLLHYCKHLILKYTPTKVFIYEGDNDLSSKKTSEEILATTKALVGKIKSKLPKVEIIIISPKPSLSRWPLKGKYLELNSDLKNYCESKPDLSFADVWYPMLNEEGNPIENIFLEDGLHMNSKGYDIWAKVLRKHIE